MIYVLGIAASFLAATIEGFVLSVLWGWFIVPVFHAPHLRIPYAIGLALVVGMLTHRTRKPEDTPETSYVLLNGLVLPWLFLLMGCLVKLFV